MKLYVIGSKSAILNGCNNVFVIRDLNWAIQSYRYALNRSPAKDIGIFLGDDSFVYIYFWYDVEFANIPPDQPWKDVTEKVKCFV